jgi:membrane protein YdbS with pleckstrin-like domain
MGYIEDTLMPGEQVRWRSRLHWIIFFWPIIFGGFSLLGIMGRQEGSSAAMLPLLLLTITWAFIAAVNRQVSEFAVTNRRVLIKTGLIRRTTIEIFLTKIESVQVQQSILGRGLDYGTILVGGTGGSHSRFHKIEAPLDFRRAVQGQISPEIESPPIGPMCSRCNVAVPAARPICPKCGQRVRISRPA